MKSTALKVKAVSDKILKTEKYPWKKLLAYQPPGLKKTTPELLEKLKASLLNNGMASTFYVWQKGKEVFSLDGHHRCMALYELEKEGHAVPDKFTCSFLNIKTEKEAKTVFMAYQSHYAKLTVSGFEDFTANMDMQALESQFQPFTMNWNFKTAAIGEIEEQDIGDAKTVAKPGDVFELLSPSGIVHRLMCGDTASEALVSFIGSEAPVMVFTDPPYGVSYSEKAKLLNENVGGKMNTRKIVSDNIGASELYKVLVAAFSNIRSIMAKNCSFYVTAPQGGDIGLMMMMMMRDAGLPVRHMIIWVKNQPTFSMNRLDYDYQHEPIFYGWKENHKFYGKGEHKTSVWQVPRPQKSKEHPTMKPVALVVNAILNSTKPGEIVFDGFTGSGTTLIACEETGRTFRGTEIEAHYCDIILKRWLNYTPGGKVTRNGKPVAV